MPNICIPIIIIGLALTGGIASWLSQKRCPKCKRLKFDVVSRQRVDLGASGMSRPRFSIMKRCSSCGYMAQEWSNKKGAGGSIWDR